tara:strand:- start:239 stop:964 length:726 start_codon:yes stop_codon:yes gene_type:complete
MKSHKTQLLFYPTLIIVALIIGMSFKNALGHLNRIDVTGGVTQDFTSDIIVAEATFKTKNIELKDAYKKLENDRKLISDYLDDNNVPMDDVVFSSINIQKKYEYKWDDDGTKYEEFSGYLLKQSIKIESNQVLKIEGLSRDITTLIDQGIEIQSKAPYYFYSKLADLKIDMIAAATKDASERAMQIANSANSSLGDLIQAKMGVFQITAKNSTEGYSWGGTHNKTSKHKTATVTMRLSYGL